MGFIHHPFCPQFVLAFLSFQLFSYFTWLRIIDDGSVLEMRIWSILLSLFSYCKNQALTLNTLGGFCKIYAQSTFFVLARGGGVNYNISSCFKFVLSLCNPISTCTFDLRFALLVPLNLKMLPTPLIKVCRLRRKTFLFLRSADYVGRPFCFCCVSYYYYFSFLFFSTAVFLSSFLRHFSTDLNQIWHINCL